MDASQTMALNIRAEDRAPTDYATMKTPRLAGKGA